MAFVEAKRSQSVGHKYTFRVSGVIGSSTRILWEGDSMAEAEKQYEAFATVARAEGSQETISMDSFRLEIERHWVQRNGHSRPPSVTRIHGKKARPSILYMPLEFQTWEAGAHSWSYAANLAYVEGLKKAGADVTVVNTACTSNHKKLIGDRRFDQVWLHGHPRHMDDFSYRQWVADIAPVRLLLCGETVHYPAHEDIASPWLSSHATVYKKWEPFITHAAFVDQADIAHAKVPAMWWQQAVPERFIRKIRRPSTTQKALFVGTLYPPRDRWAWELADVMTRVDCTESDAFRWLFDHSHEWIQRAIDPGANLGPWWARQAHRAYNLLQTRLRRHAFGNFLDALSDGLAVVSLPSQVRTYSGRVFEGMAAGRPVITQRLPGPGIFKDGEEILHYETVEDIAGHIRHLQADPEFARSVAAAGRAALLAGHTVEKRTEQLLSFVSGDRGGRA